MYYYRYQDQILCSKESCDDLTQIEEQEAAEGSDKVYMVFERPVEKSRRSFCISDPSLLGLEEEGLNLLQSPTVADYDLPQWLIQKIKDRKVMGVNRSFPNWKEVLRMTFPPKWRVHVLGMGDVGGTLITGLRLLGGDCIETIGIYDRSEEKIKRWAFEANQILSTFEEQSYPSVIGIEEDQLFDCHMFVFCASKGVPPVGEAVKDVRMIQFEGNCQLLEHYAEMARKANFQGIFAVVSDPVDLLCKYVYLASNKDKDTGKMDYAGLAPEQVRGYGLGVMHARAAYYAGQSLETAHYIQEGRAFGPHGKDLIIADSIVRYNDERSQLLTEKARNANLEIRATGFKPYIAPALSSGALSLIATIKGKWHYSATYMGGVYMGAKNRLLDVGTEVERVDIPDDLRKRLEHTYQSLADII
ncbi:MAG: lactate dehydrogenase [Bacillota bacterium]